MLRMLRLFLWLWCGIVACAKLTNRRANFMYADERVRQARNHKDSKSEIA